MRLKGLVKKVRNMADDLWFEERLVGQHIAIDQPIEISLSGQEISQAIYVSALDYLDRYHRSNKKDRFYLPQRAIDFFHIYRYPAVT